MKVKMDRNGGGVFTAWKPAGIIAEGRGSVLLRKRNGVEETVKANLQADGTTAFDWTPPIALPH